MTPTYRLTESDTPCLGLIVLQSDESLEGDFRRLFAASDARVYVSRVPSGADVTPDSLAAMRDHLSASAALLPPSVRFDAVGYGCTSGTAQIGADKVHSELAKGTRLRASSNPLTATLAAFRVLGLTKIGIVSPYITPVSENLARTFTAGGANIAASVSFGEQSEANVARIDPASIADAAKALATEQDVDGLFLSCTNLRTLDIIDPLEGELGIPILSSNQTMAWHMAQLSGARVAQPVGQLFAYALKQRAA